MQQRIPGIPSPVDKLRWLKRIAYDDNLPTSSKAIAMALAIHHNSTTGQLNPGMALISRCTSLSRRGAQCARDKLAHSGYILSIRRRRSSRASQSNNYLLLQWQKLLEEGGAMTASGDAVSARASAPSAPPGAVNAPEPVNEPLKELEQHLRGAYARYARNSPAARWLADGHVVAVHGSLLIWQAGSALSARQLKTDPLALRLAAQEKNPTIEDVEVLSPGQLPWIAPKR